MKLDETSTLGAVQVIVLRIPIVVLVDTAAFEFELAQQTGVDKLGKRSINRRAADMAGLTFGRQSIHQLVGIKMFMVAEDQLQQHLTLLRTSHAAALKIIAEPLLGSQRNSNGGQGRSGI